jgi:molybdopterin biosynthesis enzyme
MRVIVVVGGVEGREVEGAVLEEVDVVVLTGGVGIGGAGVLGKVVRSAGESFAE